MSLRPPTLVVPFLLLAAACSRTPADPGFETALPVAPGQTWDQARAALERLDPEAHEVTGVGGRTEVARTPVTVAGIRFDEVSIAGVASRPQVRSVRLSATPPAAGCDHVRDELVRALGAGWSAGEPSLGAVTATKGTTRSARIVCNGAELSLSILG